MPAGTCEISKISLGGEANEVRLSIVRMVTRNREYFQQPDTINRRQSTTVLPILFFHASPSTKRETFQNQFHVFQNRFTKRENREN